MIKLKNIVGKIRDKTNTVRVKNFKAFVRDIINTGCFTILKFRKDIINFNGSGCGGGGSITGSLR